MGYRYYDTSMVLFRYPFGYGLSYTEFAYSALEVDEKGVQLTVENAAANCADCRLFCTPRAAYNSTSSKGCKCMRNWCSRHPVWFMALYALFYLSFFALLERTIQTPDLWVHCRLDDLIPFCKYAIVPYILWFPWIPFTLFYLLYKAPREDFWRLCIPLFTGMTMTLLFYAIVPNGLALRPKYVPGTDIFAQLVRMIYRSDTPMNVCPSIHVFNSVTLMLAYYRSAIFDAPRRRWMRPAAMVLCVSISLSTILLKQHSVIDVVFGLLLALLLDQTATVLQRSPVQHRVPERL